MKKSINVIILRACFAVILTLCFVSVSCRKKDNQESLSVGTNVKEVSRHHKWYYFTDSEVLTVDKPQNVPSKTFVPWTEAVRISSANNSSSESLTGLAGNLISEQNAFALVNRLGMLYLNGGKFVLEKDVAMFENNTVQNLVFFNDTPLFSIYKSSFFNDTISARNYRNDDSQHLFLVQFDVNTGVSYPIINSSNITNLPDTEVVDYSYDGKNWLCCLKTVNENRVGFSYVKWTPTAPLLSLSPATANENIILTDATVDAYRGSKKPLEYSTAPERVKKLLSGFSHKVSFSIEVKTAGGYSSRRYVNQVIGKQKDSNESEEELKATAIISESWSAALFEDGTFFIEGALPGKHILRGGKPVAIRLPKLPPRFVYSDFVISGTTLYAAWEETDFFKTNRSGFLSLDLDSTLYTTIK